MLFVIGLGGLSDTPSIILLRLLPFPFPAPLPLTGALTIVWRLLGAVEVSDPDMLSIVASLINEDFLSRP